MHDLGQKIDYGARLTLPGIVTVFLLFLFSLPLGPDGWAAFPPHICLISLYYWSLFHPTTFPLWFIFLLGILHDALFGAPLGFSSLFFILFNRIILAQQRFAIRENFWASWCGFGLAAALFFMAYWVAMSIYSGQIVPIDTAIMQWIFTVGFYPLAHAGFNLLHRCLPEHKFHHRSL